MPGGTSIQLARASLASYPWRARFFDDVSEVAPAVGRLADDMVVAYPSTQPALPEAVPDFRSP